MSEPIELDERERWRIVENLLNNYYAYERRLEEQDFPGHLTEENCREGMENYADLLDKLSPNWREADSCADVDIRPMTVHQQGDEAGVCNNLESVPPEEVARILFIVDPLTERDMDDVDEQEALDLYSEAYAQLKGRLKDAAGIPRSADLDDLQQISDTGDAQ